jgi:hypothetical protein
LPAQPKQRIIPRLATQDEDDDEALLCVLALLSAHRRAGQEQEFDDLHN